MSDCAHGSIWSGELDRAAAEASASIALVLAVIGVMREVPTASDDAAGVVSHRLNEPIDRIQAIMVALAEVKIVGDDRRLVDGWRTPKSALRDPIKAARNRQYRVRRKGREAEKPREDLARASRGHVLLQNNALGESAERAPPGQLTAYKPTRFQILGVPEEHVNRRSAPEFPVNENPYTYKKETSALQVETHASARAPGQASERVEAPSQTLTPTQERKVKWVRSTLLYATQTLPPHQWAALVDALPDAAVLDWACKRATPPAWVRHSLEALDAKRRPRGSRPAAECPDPDQPKMLYAIDGGRGPLPVPEPFDIDAKVA